MVTVLSSPSSAKVPVAIGADQVLPLSLTCTVYCPMRPSGAPAGGR
jgi:hypothetical protein